MEGYLFTTLTTWEDAQDQGCLRPLPFNLSYSNLAAALDHQPGQVLWLQEPRETDLNHLILHHYLAQPDLIEGIAYLHYQGPDLPCLPFPNVGGRYEADYCLTQAHWRYVGKIRAVCEPLQLEHLTPLGLYDLNRFLRAQRAWMGMGVMTEVA